MSLNINDNGSTTWGAMTILVVVFAMTMPALAALSIFAFLAFGLGRRRQPIDTGSHGTARWATWQDLSADGCLRSQDSVFLGRAVGGGRLAKSVTRVYVPGERFPHLSVVGPSGSGKSTSFSAPNLLSDNPASCVVLDPKGELARLSAAWRAKRLGHEIVIVDPYKVVGQHPFRPGKINPLHLHTVAETMIVDDARRLANALVVRTADEKEPFWNNSAQVLIQAMIALLMSDAKPGEANLNRLRDILTSPNFTEEALAYMALTETCHGMLRRMAGQIRQLKGQTAASVFGMANSHLEFLDSVPVANILSETSFDPRLLLSNQMTIFLCLPVDRILEMRGLQRILVTSLINYVFQAGESRSRRVRLILDEAASLGPIDALYNAIMFGRGYGLRAMLLFQSASQVALCFPESKAADFKGTVASVFCGVNDFAGAEEVSKWIGQTTVTNFSTQWSSNWGYSSSTGQQDIHRSHNSGGGGAETFSQAGRSLIQAEELLQLPSTLSVALLPNIRPIVIEKMPYYLNYRRTPFWKRRSWHACLKVVSVLLLIISICGAYFLAGE